jgi:predicted peptidase
MSTRLLLCPSSAAPLDANLESGYREGMKPRSLATLAILAILTLTGCASAPTHYGQQQGYLAPKANGYPYLLFVPATKPQPHKGWPLLIFLHGSGERGADIEMVKVHGPPKLVSSQPDFPFVTVSPLLEAGGKWDVAKLEAMLRQTRRKLRIDPARIYLTGLSLGGHGAWRWASTNPGLFAAIVPISGRGDPSIACALKGLPAWAFHGATDSVVPAEGSTRMVDAINTCGGEARMTLYPDLGHDAWTRTYANPALYDWLLQHRRTTRR